VENNGFWRAVTSLAITHTKYLVIYSYSKGNKTDTIDNKLEDYLMQEHCHIQQLLTGAENENSRKTFW
jgi:hypothetical protein